MTGAVLAFAAASFFAAGWVVSRRGLEHRSALDGLTLSQLAATGVVLIAVLFDPPGRITATGLVAIVGAGIAANVVATWAGLSGVAALGPSFSVPVQNGVRPTVSVLLGVVLLSEPFTTLQAVGVIAIVAGGWMIMRSPPDIPTEETKDALGAMGSARRQARVPLVLVALPLVAGAGYAVSDLLQHEGVRDLGDNAAFAAFLGLSCGALVWNIGVMTIGRRSARQLLTGRGAGWMVLTGCLFGLGVLTLTLALAEGDVSIIGPIASTQPLFVLVLSAAFLSDTEIITKLKAYGACAVVVGAILLSLG